MGLRKIMIYLWSIVDPLYFACTRLQYIHREDGEPCVFRVRLTSYKGHPVVLSDGTRIQKNDVLVKIHLHNVRILKEVQSMTSDYRKGAFFYKQIRDSLPYLAYYVKNHWKAQQIKGIIGITMLDSDTLAAKLGFERHRIKNKIYKFIKQMIQYPIYYLSHVNQPSHHKHKVNIQYLFMSKNILLEKYDRLKGA